MREAFFLVGPTASGKSSVGHFLAEKRGAALVSADSMNLYRGLDIGTAKPSVEERAGVLYYGVDVVEPSDSFSVADYLAVVRPAFDAEATAIVAGGTGLYVKCLTEGFSDVSPANSALRAELEALSFDALSRRAREEAASFYEGLTADDRMNPRRLIRVLERAAAGENRASEGWNRGTAPRVVGLQVEREVLCRRIELRVDEMYAQGLLVEAERLKKIVLSPTALQAIGYAEAFAVLDGTMTEGEARERTVIRTRQLAKRQMTWFRNQLNVEWVAVPEGAALQDVAEWVEAAWARVGAAPVLM